MALLKEFGKKAGMAAGALLVSAGIALKANAAVVVMDFEQFAGDAAGVPSVLLPLSIIYEDGLRLIESQPGEETNFRATGTLSGGYTGSVAVTNFGGFTTLEKNDQSGFDLISMDIARLSTDNGEFTTFEGVTASGQNVTQTFSLTGVAGPVLTTFNFNSDFNNVVSVGWQDGNLQMDNITANTVATPLPASALLLASGIGGLIGFRSLSKQKTQPNEYNI